MEAPPEHDGDPMSAIDSLRTAPQDRYKAVTAGDAPSVGERRLEHAAREGLRAMGLVLVAIGIMAGLMSLRFLGFLPSAFHFHG